MSVYLAVALFLGATKHVPVEQAQATCAGYGLPSGTAEYADCVKIEHEGFEPKHQYDLGDPYSVSHGINDLSSSPRDEDEDIGYIDPSLNFPTANATLRSSYVSGRNRICTYDGMGSRESTTVDATAPCPQSDAEVGIRMGRRSPRSDYHPFGDRMLRSSYVSGQNRICVYDRVGSREETTVGAAAQCPFN
jgi:hypothetical protein